MSTNRMSTIGRIMLAPERREAQVAGASEMLGRYSLLVCSDSLTGALLITTGAALFLLIAALSIVLIVRHRSTIRWRREPTPVLVSVDRAGELHLSLERAVALNAYKVNARNDPNIRLKSAVRLRPPDFQAATHAILHHFRGERVISLDLGGMNASQAAQLVNFCSGMTAATDGWIFQLSAEVLVLSPTDNRQ